MLAAALRHPLSFVSNLRERSRERSVQKRVEEEVGYAEFMRHVEESAEQAAAGTLALLPDTLWIRASENCNLQCVGCYTAGVFKKVYIPVEQARQLLSTKRQFKLISLTTSEAFLHPKLCDLLEACKELQPNAMTWIISNGTIPIKGRYRRAVSLIDRLGLSIDGATKETYEAIRKGAVFEKFIENVREIVEVRKESGNPKELGFAFTATASNLRELPGVIRLAHELGIWAVWAQPMEMKHDEITARISHVHIDTMDPAERTKIIDDAKAEAERLGMPFWHSGGLYPSQHAPAAAERDASIEAKVRADMTVRMCTYPWTEPSQIVQKGETFQLRPCCYIKSDRVDELAKMYGFEYPELKPMDEIYNSREFWAFRKDLAAGKLNDICGACDAAKSYQWKPKAAVQPSPEN